MNRRLALALTLLLSLAGIAPAQNQGPLQFVGVEKSKTLDSVTSVTISSDGRFLYASAWKAKTHTVFLRDLQTGKLTSLQTINDPGVLDGATALRLSNSGKLAASAAFRSKTLTLYTRNPKTGLLSMLDVKTDRFGGVKGLSFALDAMFSTDDKHVFALNHNTGITSFSVSGKEGDERLGFIGQNQIANLTGPRGLKVHPDGRTVFAACYKSHCLYVLQRNVKTGRLTLKQALKDGENNMNGLQGCFGVAVSPQGDFVYTTSGRFGGDSSIGVFKFNSQKKTLSLVQELIQDGNSNDLPSFSGGNEIAVSPDGKSVYAVATKSGSIASLSRNVKTGKLSLLEVVTNADVKDAAGVAVSPDSKFVYVAAEGASQIAIYRKK